MKTIISILALAALCPLTGRAAQNNIAPQAHATVSDALSGQYGAEGLNDGLIRYDGRGEWACRGAVASWGVMHMPWAQLEWDEEVTIERVVLYDRVSPEEHLAGGTLRFSDGSEVSVTGIPNDGSPRSVTFAPRKVKWMRFEATDGAGKNIGLSEIEVFPARDERTSYVEWADPWIETTRGRWFFCTPAARPMGMVAAHAFTRNKNQGGGGYNYNFPDILGFTQINDWMIAGPNVMPAAGDVDPMQGMAGWKSPFSHESEIIQPGYHRLYLDRYNAWVEYTATDRAALYRVNYTKGEQGKLLVDVGSTLGNCSMNRAKLYRMSDTVILGELMTTDRFWGGPDSIALFFVLECNRPFTSADGWNEQGVMPCAEAIAGDQAGMVLNFDLKESGEVLFKIGMSYTSLENAVGNLKAELDGWDFDAVRGETQAIWNEMLGRMAVEGGSEAQQIKFYTDLWHVLLGRHKISDVNGWYPDYTGGKYVDKRTSDPMKLRRVELDANGAPKFNMYGFDGLWLTQWNLNVLWGLAWPEIMDDFTACLVQYADNGGLLPRGACAGGYSFIMTGCPASSMLVSAYMKGIMKKTDPLHAYEAIKRNHLPGGMMSHESADDLKFYIRNGWCPGNAGKTLEWAFQDWGLSRMATRLGKKADAREFERRAHGWTPLFNAEQGLIFPKKRDGEWLHLDPLNGKGWVEANAWQGTWSLSFDLPKLVGMMGGGDAFCDKLNHAFEQARRFDFLYEYGDGGYVSYANQPGCSNAHLFTYGGKPWLTQYWVRQVKERAYGGITPDKGYGGHDEDQGQMGGVSALMAIGLFSVTGTESDVPYYDITSPIFDRVTIRLNPDYYPGREFVITTHDNSAGNCYIRRAELNGQPWDYAQFDHEQFIRGGKLELWLGEQPNKEWGKLKYLNPKQ